MKIELLLSSRWIAVDECIDRFRRDGVSHSKSLSHLSNTPRYLFWTTVSGNSFHNLFSKLRIFVELSDIPFVSLLYQEVSVSILSSISIIRRFSFGFLLNRSVSTREDRSTRMKRYFLKKELLQDLSFFKRKIFSLSLARNSCIICHRPRIRM